MSCRLKRRATRLWPAAAALFLLIASALAFLHLRETPLEIPVLRTTLLPPDNTALDFSNGRGLPALSPDGRRIVFGARTVDGKQPLWVRSLDALTAQPLAGTDGAAFPFWSPDSRFIGFFADRKLKKIDASGGPTITLADAPLGRGGSWSQDGVIVFAPSNVGSSILRVASAGGAATPVSSEEGRLPWFLPDGHHFLFSSLRATGEGAFRVGSLDGAPSKAVGQASSNTVYAQGHLLFLREGTLMAQPFDTRSLATTGEAVPVAEQVESVLNSGTVGAFSVSQTGLLAFHSGLQAGGEVLTWFDRSGKQLATLGDPANIGELQFSPDRTSLAAVVGGRPNNDIWTYDMARGLPTRFTFDPANDSSPVWSPDGRTIVFRSNRKGHFDLYRRSANGAGVEELLYADNLERFPTNWSPDGKFLLFDAIDRKTNRDIWALPLTPQSPGGQLKPFPVLQTPFAEGGAEFSPDGRWIAYMSSESQRTEIYVAPFPGPGGKRQVSKEGGALPRWRRDGKEIFYVGNQRLTAAAVTAKGESVEIGEVRPLFGPIGNVGLGPSYEVSADGQRFLVPVPPAQKAQEPLTLIVNWAAGVKR